MSRHWRGFRLFDEPSYMFGFGNAHLCMPWEVWGVKPTRLLRYEATAVADFAGRQLRARHIEVVQLMPPGFKFGPNGGTVRRLVEKLAQVPQRPPTEHQGRSRLRDRDDLSRGLVLPDRTAPRLPGGVGHRVPRLSCITLAHRARQIAARDADGGCQAWTLTN